jgi:hypothetical protein
VFVRNIDAPTNEPIQAEVCFPPSSSFCQGQGVGSSITVPTTNAAGRAVERMTLEYVSGVCFNNLVFIEAQVLSTVGGAGPVRHHLIPVPGEPGWTHFAQPVRIYGDAGTIIRIGGTTNGEGACDFAFSGHLTLK